MELLKYGVKQGDISDKDIEKLAMHIMFFIEGISTMAITSILTEEIIDAQIDFVKNMIFTHK